MHDFTNERYLTHLHTRLDEAMDNGIALKKAHRFLLANVLFEHLMEIDGRLYLLQLEREPSPRLQLVPVVQ
jgi:hypothetical protein